MKLKANDKIKIRFKRFLIIWGYFVLLGTSAGLLSLFILVPLIAFFKSGNFIFYLSVEFVLSAIKTIALSSTLGAIVIWLWVEFFPNMKIK